MLKTPVLPDAKLGFLDGLPPHQLGEAIAFGDDICLPIGDGAAYGISTTTVAFRGDFPSFSPL